MDHGFVANEFEFDKQYRFEFERMAEIVQALFKARELQGIMEIVRREARALLASDGATFVLREGDYCYYADEDAIGPLWKGQRFPIDACVSGWAMRHSQPAIVEDVSSDWRTQAEYYRSTFAKSMLVVPIRLANPVGAIGNYWSRRHRPGGHEIRLAQALAETTAVAIENVLLRSDLESRVRARTEALERELSERKHTEDMLRESEEFFLGVAASTTNAIISIDGERRIVFFNHGAEAMFGHQRADIVGTPVDRLIPPRLRAVHVQGLNDFLERGDVGTAHDEIPRFCGFRANGEEFPARVSFSRMVRSGKTIVTMIVEDITRRIVTKSALAASEEQLRFVTEAAEIGYWHCDVATDEIEWSPRCRELVGIQEEGLMTRARFLAAVHPDDRERVEAALEGALVGKGEYDIEFRVVKPGGEVRWVHGKGRTTFDEQGAPVRLGGIALDVTERKAMESVLRASEANFRALADTAPAVLWLTDATGACSFISKGWYEFTGQPDGGGLDFGWLDAVHPQDRQSLTSKFEAKSAGRKPFEFEHRVRRADGSYSWVIDSARPRFAPNGTFLGYIGSVFDITERKAAEEIIRQNALHDPLTGLPNRALTFEFAEHLLAGSQRGKVRGAVLFIDLDRFKPINDVHGHNVGDEVLKEVAARLQHCVRREDVVGRIGGDEFLAVLAHIHSTDDAAHAASHILARLSEPYRISHPDNAVPLELDTSPSIGISLFPDHGQEIAMLVSRADEAMYRAKAAGRRGYEFYTGMGPRSAA